MKKLFFIIITIPILNGCLLDDNIDKYGTFKRDEDMSQFFMDNYEYFYEASLLLNQCQYIDVYFSDSELIETLDLINLYCREDTLNKALVLTVYRWVEESASSYRKGYFYSEDPSFLVDQHEGNLNRRPKTDHCYDGLRYISVDENYSGWYLFTDHTCGF